MASNQPPKNPALDQAAQSSYLKLWLELARTSKTIEQQMEERLQTEFNQSFARFDVLSQLERFDPERLPMGVLAGNLLASKGNITRLIDRMIKDELIDRKPSPQDRRIIQVGFTNQGRQLFKKMAQAHAQWSSEILGGITKKDADRMLKMLRTLQATSDID
ncbi:MarR family winged helix-turn-helix transcriptional regulator [Halioxenophilus aromaticivorans]|uniref:MarR family transcriptional regulator n=1 Tax=Halioxenophilus aromaticivorans TaxID=1306992 RepID=A0AAV3TYM3_9ALTE